MKRYLFTIRLIGCGDNVDDAWWNAAESTDLLNDTTPESDDWELLEEEDES